MSTNSHPLVLEAQTYDILANVHVTMDVERQKVNISDRQKAFKARKEAREQ